MGNRSEDLKLTFQKIEESDVPSLTLVMKRAFDDDALLGLLSRHPLRSAEIHNWNSFYDLAWARKEGQASPAGRGGDHWSAWLRGAEQYALDEGILKARGAHR